MNWYSDVQVTSAPVQQARMTSHLVMDIESTPLESAHDLTRL